jgi:AcrR family transcriptional regulator
MHVSDRRHRRRTQAERTETTRTALIDAARALFAEHGYADVGTEEIVRAAGVTRGALYHHFGGKEELFLAVYERVEEEVTQRIADRLAARLPGDPIEVLRKGARLFLEMCTEPDVQQIALIDAPSVVGWEKWRAVGERYGLGLIQAALQNAIDTGAIANQPVRPLAHILLGGLDEAALLVARAGDQKRARREVGKTLDRILTGLAAT